MCLENCKAPCCRNKIVKLEITAADCKDDRGLFAILREKHGITDFEAVTQEWIVERDVILVTIEKPVYTEK